ncbi:MAG: glyoxalase/bleomycin resistance/dioxygenase family protein [Zetaproteobacteria bacterium CG12_big_fil_rev_8_21_14_0_65_54_13]|nr:MAG: glyoxalase/bleomycin resistance/dioxygenase family protein [Zetaproteobacteria bacterium CG12_big_fil_rev_8_21_14_0_65_54_13]
MFSVHHVALSVQSLHASVAFYDVFGFKPVYSWSSEDDKLTIVHLSHGDTLLELFCYRQPDPAPDSSHALATDLPRIGIKHFGLRVQDIHAAHAHLQQLGMSEGVAICHGRTGIDYFFIKDPSGILLEVVQDDRKL